MKDIANEALTLPLHAFSCVAVAPPTNATVIIIGVSADALATL